MERDLDLKASDVTVIVSFLQPVCAFIVLVVEAVKRLRIDDDLDFTFCLLRNFDAIHTAFFVVGMYLPDLAVAFTSYAMYLHLCSTYYML